MSENFRRWLSSLTPRFAHLWMVLCLLLNARKEHITQVWRYWHCYPCWNISSADIQYLLLFLSEVLEIPFFSYGFINRFLLSIDLVKCLEKSSMFFSGFKHSVMAFNCVTFGRAGEQLSFRKSPFVFHGIKQRAWSSLYHFSACYMRYV